MTVCFDGKMIEFASGKELAEYEFEKPYAISKIQAENNRIIVGLHLRVTTDSDESFF